MQPGPLADRIRNGEPEAFDELVREYFAPLARFAYSYTKSVDSSEDVAQDVLVWTWENRQKLDPKGSLAAYLHAAVRNRSLDYLRRSRTEETFRSDTLVNTESESFLSDTGLLDALARDDDIAAMRKVLNNLPERRRTALRLRYSRNMSYEEVAQVLGITPKAAKELVYRTIETLRSALGLPLK